jgi:hypothetical protein
MARGIVLEDRSGGALAYVGDVLDHIEAERQALLDRLRQQARENRARARQQASATGLLKSRGPR